MDIKEAKLLIKCVLFCLPGLFFAGAFKSVGSFIGALVGVAVGIGLACAAADSIINGIASYSTKPTFEARKQVCEDAAARPIFYALCVCVLFTVTAFTVAVISAPREPGDEEESTGLVVTEYVPGPSEKKQEEMKLNMLFALFAPSLIGVRLALGDKKTKS
jgi:hypothetical protein